MSAIGQAAGGDASSGASAASAPPSGKPTTLRHPLALTLLSLTFTTGIVDAGSYLLLGHVFTANMTGNVVLLGWGLAGAGHLPVVAPIVSLLAFLVGAGVAGRIANLARRDDSELLRIALAIEFCMVAIATGLAFALSIRPGSAVAYVTIALLAVAMGVRNATVRRIALPDLTTTVLTMTLTGLAADSRLAGGNARGTARRLTATSALLAGALAGGLLTLVDLGATLALAATCVAVSLIAYSRWAGSR